MGEVRNKARPRCAWVSADQACLAYHDQEWGVAIHDDLRLFEMLILEGAQAGLSWVTILKRRDSYRLAYDGFDPQKMAQWNRDKLVALQNDPGIIRNRLKIEAARTNARAYLQVVDECGSFARFIWSFGGGQPLDNGWQRAKQIPVMTPKSEEMSRALRLRGFKFVGPTICYAFMQAVGMVNDHLVGCFRYELIRAENNCDRR